MKWLVPLSLAIIGCLMITGSVSYYMMPNDSDSAESVSPEYMGTYEDGDLYRLDVQPKPIYYYEREDGTIKIVSFVTTTGSINVVV